jgi:glycosyltransferase involved in cell wall biosynthesis
VYHDRPLSTDELDQLTAAMAVVAEWCPEPGYQVVSFPAWWPIAMRLRAQVGWPAIYDCHDLLSGFADIDESLLDMEGKALVEADLRLYSSETLKQAGEKSVRGRPGLLLRNGVNTRDFAVVAARDRKQSVVAGYVGALDDWFDWDGIRAAAVAAPDVTFRLVGRVREQDRTRLEGLNNVTFRGEVPYEQVGNELSEFDVALIPFVLNELTSATNPVKLYEYFAAGLPVVSSALPEVMRYRDLVQISERDYASAIRRAVADDSPVLRARRRVVAEQESWRARADALLEALQHYPDAVRD